MRPVHQRWQATLRALCHTGIREIRNRTIKLRETFKPFAPCGLREHVQSRFEVDCDAPNRAHAKLLTASRHKSIAAVVNVTGSTSLQTIRAAANPDYHALIGEGWCITGMPKMLNTPFNENAPNGRGNGWCQVHRAGPARAWRSRHFTQTRR
jgi:carbamoyltransferase